MRVGRGSSGVLQGGLWHWRDTPSQEEKPRRAHVNEWACVCGMAGWAFERKPEALEETPEDRAECGSLARERPGVT